MNINKYLNDKFNKKLVLTKTNKGLTNDIYYTTINNINCVVRVPKEDVDMIINTTNEKKVLPLIKNTDLDVEELYYFEDSRVRITKYVESFEFNEIKSEKSIIEVAKLLKKFHNYKFKINSEFDIIEMFYKYYNSIKNPLFNIDKYLNILDDIKDIKNEHILCHNDLVSGNLLFTDSKTYLIDYEYAADNDPLFDLTSFTTENNLSDQESKMFYNEYFNNNISSIISKQIIIFERFQNLLWLCWANMMYENRKDKIYKTIVENKYKQLQKTIRKEIL
jgi:thiamine kinase-like enzyme